MANAYVEYGLRAQPAIAGVSAPSGNAIHGAAAAIETLTTTGSQAVGTVVGSSSVSYARVTTDAPCWVAVGTAPDTTVTTATAASSAIRLLPPGVPVDLALAIGQKVAVLAASVSPRVPTADKPRFFNVAGTTLVRPNNTTAYSQNDSISDNATAGSVTALSCTPSDANDDPICLTELLLDTNDTGLAAGVSVRAYLYNSNPISSSGVGAGDNAAFSNKKAGLVGTMSGTFRAMSDGGKARLVPDEGSFIIANPVTGGVTIWAQFQVISAAGFTPSANSTTIDWRAKGFQGRA